MRIGCAKAVFQKRVAVLVHIGHAVALRVLAAAAIAAGGVALELRQKLVLDESGSQTELVAIDGKGRMSIEAAPACRTDAVTLVHGQIAVVDEDDPLETSTGEARERAAQRLEVIGQHAELPARIGRRRDQLLAHQDAALPALDQQDVRDQTGEFEIIAPDGEKDQIGTAVVAASLKVG